MLWYNTERPHLSLNKKSPLQYFCDIINSNKSEFSQTGMTYTLNFSLKEYYDIIFFLIFVRRITRWLFVKYVVKKLYLEIL
jgi:hypothetical protein